MNGSKINIWKQDPSIAYPHIRPVYLHGDIKDGPEDEFIVNWFKNDPSNGLEYVAKKDKEGNFNYKANKSPGPFDVAHAYAVSRIVLNMYRRALYQTGVSLKEGERDKNGLYNFSKRWESKLRLNVYAFNKGKSVYVNKSQNVILFGFIKNGDKTIYTCRSFDVVAHETGHAVFYALRKEHEGYANLQTRVIEESFCDLTIILALLSQLDMCDTVISMCQMNLWNPNFLSRIAEQFGKHCKTEHGEALRCIIDEDYCAQMRKKPLIFTTIHDHSINFTGAIYEFLVTIFQRQLDPLRENPAERLFKYAKKVTSWVIGIFYETAIYPQLSYSILVEEMFSDKYKQRLQLSEWDWAYWKGIMIIILRKREIVHINEITCDRFSPDKPT
ncbi:MAG: hypothetical protein AAFP19_18540 [Bacteroidota bacterium]